MRREGRRSALGRKTMVRGWRDRGAGMEADGGLRRAPGAVAASCGAKEAADSMLLMRLPCQLQTDAGRRGREEG